MNAPNHMNCMDFDIPNMMNPSVTNAPPNPIILRVPNFSMQVPYTVKLTIVLTMLSIVNIVMNCAVLQPNDSTTNTEYVPNAFQPIPVQENIRSIAVIRPIVE